MSQHPGSHFLIIIVLSKDGNDNYQQLVHDESLLASVWMHRQHRSDVDSGDDTISALIWEAMSVQSNCFSVGKSVFM